MSTDKVFMAYSSGKESSEGIDIKRYIGVAPVFVIGVNPNNEELSKLYGFDIENIPEYTSNIEIDGNMIKSARIDFIIKTDVEKSNGIDLISKATFFLRKEFRYNKDKTKVQVIDKYGRTAWVTQEQAKNKEIPVYKNGPANLDSDYRPCYVGEEDLNNFIKNYLNIPNVMKYVNGTWIMVDKPEDSEARLDKVSSYFEGDFSELRSIIKLQPNNKVKAMFGIRSTDEGKTYQTVYTQMFLKNNVNDYSNLDKDYQERKMNGAYPTTEFKAEPIKEYVIEETNLTEDYSIEQSPFSDGWLNN